MEIRVMNTGRFLGLLLSAALLCGGCTEAHHDHEHEEAEHEHEHGHSSDDIIMDGEKAKAAGVEVETLQPGVFHDVIKSGGKVMAASCDESTVTATTTGLVTHSHDMSEGMTVRRGATLFYISSSSLQDGDVAQKAYINMVEAKKEYERMKSLVDDKIVTRKDYDAAYAAYEKARLAYQAVEGSVTSKGVAVSSPVTGYIKECKVKDGDYVEVGDPLMTVTKNKHLYLRAEVPVRYYASLGKVTSARFRTQYSDAVLDLSDMNGQLLSLGKTAVSATSYVPVTFQFDNNDQVVPGAYAEVFLMTGDRDSVLSLPLSAITEEQGLYYVYLKKDDHSYAKREVSIGATDGTRVEITGGLKGGEDVVVKGAVSVKLAGASTVVPGHTHNH